MYGTKYHVTKEQAARYPDVKIWVLRNRLTKTAKGITQTAARSNHRHDGDVLRLSVRGTTDSLTGWTSTRRKQNGRVSLTTIGRSKLQRLRRNRP